VAGDPRIERYARVLVETCLDIQPRSQVLLDAGVLARPLVEEIVRLIAQKGAWVITRLSFSRNDSVADPIWATTAPEELVGELPPAELELLRAIDGLIVVLAPENVRDGSELTPARQALVAKAHEPVIPRMVSGDLPWVGCYFPTQASAQAAGMTLAEFEDFVYGACLIDWDAERERMQRIADRFDAADEVRIVAAETDLTLSIAGRQGRVDAGGANMPGGEFFFSPVEDSAEGEIAFLEYPAVRGGVDVEGVRLRFEGGRVVEASARTNEGFLLAMLDTDDGARRLGELGIGCNPAIQRHMRNTLFDEKIDGTVHLALGRGFPFIGGTNESALHWDIVKDLRRGGQLYLDGELVQRDGAWAI
jgi:aminopeptidase